MTAAIRSVYFLGVELYRNIDDFSSPLPSSVKRHFASSPGWFVFHVSTQNEVSIFVPGGSCERCMLVFNCVSFIL